MSKTIFVAFGHRKRVGKDTAGRFLCSHLRIAKKSSNIQVASFASKLKDICYQLYSWAGLQPGDFYEEPENEKLKDIILPLLGKTPRRVWIEMGTHVGRTIFPDTWTEYLFRNTICDVCIIRDMRFPNEADQVLNLGGFVYRIDRTAAPNDSDEADDPLINYAHWTGIIENNGSFAELSSKIVRIGDDILKVINDPNRLINVPMAG